MRSARFRRSTLPALAALALGAAGAAQPAAGQALAVIVNGDPITTTEVEEQIKYRRVIHQSATREEAIEDLIGDRLKLRAANRQGVDASDADFVQVLNQVATKAKTSSSALASDFQRAKLNIDLVRSHLRAMAAWNDLVKARYKALNVSEQEVDAAISRDASLGKAQTDYTLQQIVFVLPAGASPTMVEQRTREAQALRGRFADCATGVPLARALPDVAVKPPVNKTEATLSDGSRKALQQVERGRLTQPDRTPAGIEMIAVCNREDVNNATSIRDGVRATLLVDRLSKEADAMYKELRTRAVVDKR